MTFIYAKEDAAARRTRVTLDGYLVGYCEGVNDEAHTVKVVVVEPRPGRRPRPMRVADGVVDAFVRANFLVYQGPANPAAEYRRGAFVYLTPAGWIDEQSNPVPLPFEICQP